MKYAPKFKAMWKGEEYTVTAMHLLEDPYVMLEPRNEENYKGEEDIYVEFSELDSFYEVEPKYYIKLKYNLFDKVNFIDLYFKKTLAGGQDLFSISKVNGIAYQTEFTYSEIMKLPKDIQNGLNGGLLELEEVK